MLIYNIQPCFTKSTARPLWFWPYPNDKDVPMSTKRNGTLLTDALCQKRVAKRVKFYDRKCPGLYVSITTKGVATFSCNFTDGGGRATSRMIGIYHPEGFKVTDARFFTSPRSIHSFAPFLNQSGEA